jgi:hypothetical protein
MFNNLKKNFKSKIALTLLLSLTVFGVARIYYRLTDDFRISNMTYEIAHNHEWEIASITPQEHENLSKILDQKYSYLGKGAQSYVFTSEDGLYVIKFFKFKHLKPSIFLNALPPLPPFSNYVKKETIRKDRKLKSVFNGYKLAYEIHKYDSGLVFIHLNKTENFINKTVTVFDKIGREHKIDLDTNVFLLQRKGETLRTVMTDLLKKNDIVVAKQRIRQIFDLYVTEYKKGAYDHDHGVMHNTGFVGTEPIHLDVGKFSPDENICQASVYKSDLKIIYRKIDLWLKNNFPHSRDEIVKDMEEKFNEVTM